ncbi:MAG: hypothetical protein ACSHYA_17110 [Opitutaceae bacterium]
MNYEPEHAARALAILEELQPLVTPQPEYIRLIEILREPSRWSEAHDQFTAIRVNITLKNEVDEKSDLDSLFAHLAENAAKTAYNCSGSAAPFDDDSFDRLLRFQQQFIDASSTRNL